jgi:hypothetical protein
MSTTNLLITFNLNGTASCLWTEAVALQEPDSLRVHRASITEFNPSEQKREVRLESNPDTVAFSHVSRSIFLVWGREALQAA